MLCCQRSAAEVKNMLPYEYRLYLLNTMREAVEKKQLSEVKKKLKELKNILAVELTPKTTHILQFPHMLQAMVYVVERPAHRQIYKLEDALIDNNYDAIKNRCRILQRMFEIPTDEEILHQIDHENTINLKMIKKTNRNSFRLYNCDLLQAENLKMCHRILKSCHELTKIQLEYCKIDDRTMAILLKPLAIHPQLTYLGLKGNNLSTETLIRLEELLENRNNFQHLLWIDTTINNGINSLPRPLIEALVKRWPRHIRKNIASTQIKLSVLDILQARLPRPLLN